MRMRFKDRFKTVADTVRPLDKQNFIGQQEAVDAIDVALQGLKNGKKSIEHMVFYGPPGTGKTTLSNMIGISVGRETRTTIGTALRTEDDLIRFLSRMKEGEVAFIDEIHRMPMKLEEMLYTVMEDYFLDTSRGRINYPEFTLLGATTRLGDLSAPLRDRFVYNIRLQLYTCEELIVIACRAYRGSLDGELVRDTASMLAQAARGTPRLIIGFMKKLEDLEHALVGADATQYAQRLLELEGLTAEGLDRTDVKMLEALLDGPLGIQTLASITGQEIDTLKEVNEPYLVHEEYMVISSRGRQLTLKGKNYVEARKNG